MTYAAGGGVDVWRLRKEEVGRRVTEWKGVRMLWESTEWA